MLKVAAYARVSTDKEDQINSLTNQREYFESYINKTRKIYKTKREFLISQLKIFGGKAQVIGENAGHHILLKYYGKHLTNRKKCATIVL